MKIIKIIIATAKLILLNALEYEGVRNWSPKAIAILEVDSWNIPSTSPGFAKFSINLMIFAV